MGDWSVLGGLTEGQRRILSALVEGYRARAGMKDRIRALNEWEIARRSGSTSLSYAEFSHDPARQELIQILGELQRLGLVSTWDRGINYDTFVPTERGDSVVTTAGIAPAGSAADGEFGSKVDRVIERLDEVIELLKSIEARLPEGR